MRSRNVLAWLVSAGALAASCARGVDGDLQDVSEVGDESATTEEPTVADDEAEDAGMDEMPGVEDEDRAREPEDLPSSFAETDAGSDAQADTDANRDLDAGVTQAPDSALDDGSAEGTDATLDERDAEASAAQDASASSSTPSADTDPDPTTNTPAQPPAGAEPQEPPPAPGDEPAAPDEPPPPPTVPEPEVKAGCNNAAACSEPCFPVGLLACCREDGSCGCTWAPGAYCL